MLTYEILGERPTSPYLTQGNQVASIVLFIFLPQSATLYMVISHDSLVSALSEPAAPTASGNGQD